MHDFVLSIDIEPNDPLSREAALDVRALVTARSEVTRTNGDFTLVTDILSEMSRKVFGQLPSPELASLLEPGIRMHGAQLAALALLAETALRLPAVLAKLADERGEPMRSDEVTPARIRELLFQSLKVENGQSL